MDMNVISRGSYVKSLEIMLDLLKSIYTTYFQKLLKGTKILLVAKAYTCDWRTITRQM